MAPGEAIKCPKELGRNAKDHAADIDQQETGRAAGWKKQWIRL
jgi:hypothetical protein